MSSVKFAFLSTRTRFRGRRVQATARTRPASSRFVFPGTQKLFFTRISLITSRDEEAPSAVLSDPPPLLLGHPAQRSQNYKGCPKSLLDHVQEEN